MTLRRLFPIFPLLALTACEQGKEHTAPAVWERDSASVMTTYGVNTLISDSGVIKYRIVSEVMDVNQVRTPQRWTFEKGIFLQQFDEHFHVEAFIQADTAWYYNIDKIWELRGRVTIRNTKGLFFSSEELFWNERRHEFYSNLFSRLITPERTMEGTYFLSDEHLLHYTVNNSKGSFKSSDIEGEAEGGESSPSSASTSSGGNTPESAEDSTDRQKVVTPERQPAKSKPKSQ